MDNIEKIIDKVYICLAKNSLDENDKTILLSYAEAYTKLQKAHNNNELSPEGEKILNKINGPYLDVFSKNNLTPGDKFILEYYQNHIFNENMSTDKGNTRILSTGHSILESDQMGFFKISSILIMTILLGFILAIITIYIK